jgi:hypothetical protein
VRVIGYLSGLLSDEISGTVATSRSDDRSGSPLVRQTPAGQ